MARNVLSAGPAAQAGTPSREPATVGHRGQCHLLRHAQAGDVRGLQIATDLGNNIVTLDEAETARWKAAAQPTIDQWFADMEAAGVDGKALYDQAVALVAAEAGM